MERREFLRKAGRGTAGLLAGLSIPQKITERGINKEIPRIVKEREFTELPSPEYTNISHDEIQWENISQGLKFSRTPVYKNKKLVDIIAGVKINPEINKLNVHTNYNKDNDFLYTIKDWQENTNSLAIINSGQYLGMPNWAKPCALAISNGKQMGPKYNKHSKGMFLAEPKQNLEIKNKLKKADLLDFEYDKFNREKTQYTEGVQHWPILLDRQGKVKVKPSLWQANRTAIAKTNQDEIMFLTTEGGYFTLYNLGQFLRDSNKRNDKGFNIHTAMNLDGGYEACMAVKTPKLHYITFGEFETQGPGKDFTVFGAKSVLPTVIGVSKRH